MAESTDALLDSTYTYVNSNSATQVSVPCPEKILVRVVINKAGASANLLTLYDAANGTTGAFAVIDTTAVHGSIEYGVRLQNGLSAVLNTGTAADVTLVTK